MVVKKVCFKVRLVPVYLLLLIILSTSLIAWLASPTSVEASHLVSITPNFTGDCAITEPTQTTDIAVNGNVIYVTIKGIFGWPDEFHERILLKSTDGGNTWINLTNNLPDSIVYTDYVAVASDDPNFIVVVDRTSFAVAFSTNGGITWTTLVNPPVTAINDVDISPLLGGMRHIALAGVAGGVGAIYYISLGVVAPSWINAVSVFGNAPTPLPDAFWAVKFSPNFLADQCLLSVSSKDTHGVQLNVASFNTYVWNSFVDDTFPRKLTTAGAYTVNSVDITLDTDFFIGEPVTQIGFIGASLTDGFGTEIGGVYCIGTYTVISGNYTMTRILPGVAINSVAWDGTNLFAGAYLNNTVYRSTNALSPSPTFTPIVGIDAPAGEGNTLVTLSASVPNVIAATSGVGSGISRSTDGDITFQMILPYHLDSPILLSPPDNATGIAQNPAFSWQAVPYAALYLFELAYDPDFTTVIYTTDTSQTSIEMPVSLALQLGDTYYWRVKCLAPIESNWSSVFTFTVNVSVTPPPVYTPEISIDTSSGMSGSIVTVTGTDCMPNTDAKVWFDSNGNMAYNSGEPFVSFVTTGNGNFPPGIALVVPSLSAGSYTILADIPIAGTVEASAEFEVMPTPTPTPDGFPVGPVAGGIAGGAIVIGGGIYFLKKWLENRGIEELLRDYKPGEKGETKAEKQQAEREEIEKKLKDAGIEIEVKNKVGKPEVKRDTPFRLDKGFSIKVIKGPGKHNVVERGSPPDRKRRAN